MNIEKFPPHLLAPGSNSLVPYIEIGGPGDKLVTKILFMVDARGFNFWFFLFSFLTGLLTSVSLIEKRRLIGIINFNLNTSRQLVSIILPWMHVAIRVGNEVTLEQMKAAIFTNIKRFCLL